MSTATNTRGVDPPLVPPGLVHADDAAPGYGRRRSGRGFVYLDERGKRLTDADTVDRLRRLAVPPAWTEVWFSPDPCGHIQATGRDAKGRKQYRYHDEWQRARHEAKFDSLVDFGHALPVLRQQVVDDMGRRELDARRVVATTVWLLDRTLIRIGNDEYSGDSFGLTTLLDDHVQIEGSRLRFRFVGKGGKEHDVKLADRRIARIVSRCQELPGQQLLQYLDDEGRVRKLGSRDVNEYLRDVTPGDFTAKTFRTWGGSAFALEYLVAAGPPTSDREATQQVRAAIKETAKRLRNTPTVCRTSYVHPAIPEAHASGELHARSMRRGRRHELLDDSEIRLLQLLDANDGKA
jgi:DNA topoisomerase-1